MDFEAIYQVSDISALKLATGLMMLLLGIASISILAAILTRVAFDLFARTLSNGGGLNRWLRDMPDHARAYMSHQILYDDGPSQGGTGRHLRSLHPRRLGAQVANRLHAAAETQPHGVIKFLREVDRMDEDPQAHAGPADSETAMRRSLSARIEAVVDALQVRLTHRSLLYSYLIALLSALGLTLMAAAATRVSGGFDTWLTMILVGLFGGLVGALLHIRFDRPSA